MQFPVELPDHILTMAAARGVRMDDIEEHFTRSRGHGGQRVNKRDTCVQLRHVPTGLMVRCERARDQLQNRVAAYTELIELIDAFHQELEREEAEEKYKQRAAKRGRTRASKSEMLREKKRRGEIKEQRRKSLLG